MELTLLIIAAAVFALPFLLIRRSNQELESLRAGYIPPSWEVAYRKAHPKDQRIWRRLHSPLKVGVPK